MISYHPKSLKMPVGTTFTAGFQTANVETAAQFAKCMAAYAWSNCVWDGGYRVKKGFIGASWFALDFDSPEMTLVEAQRAFCDMTHVIGTTRNHQKEKDGVKCDRFRVVIKAERIMHDVNEYEFNMRKMTEKYPIDRACVDGARHYFKCSEIVQVVDEGYSQEVSEYIDENEMTDQEYTDTLESLRIHYRATGNIPRRAAYFLENGATENRHYQTYMAALSLLEAGVEDIEAIKMLKAAPITRPYADNEVENIVRHIADRIKQRTGHK